MFVLFLMANIILQYDKSGFPGGDQIKEKCPTEKHEKCVYLNGNA